MKWERALTSVARQMIMDHVEEKNNLVAVDATVGNGNDTLFLAQLVGSNGIVYGFDIQQKAIDITRNKLCDEGFREKTTLVCDSHENIDQYVPTLIHIGMFNLGYLPQGSKNIITHSNSTICAIRKCVKQLAPNGIVTILCYPGHSGGDEEEWAVYQLLKEYSAKEYIISKIDIVNVTKISPVLYIIVKKTDS